MYVRLLYNNDTEEAKTLWKSAFGDSDDFIDTYFRNKVLPGNSLGIFDGGLKSVVHMIPFKIRVQGRSIQSSFIAGAATADESRKQGLMKMLLHESLELMRGRGILMTHLYPFLHSFYENFGWATYCYADKKIVTKGSKADRVEQTTDINLLHSMYHNMTKGMDGYVIRSEKEWNWRLEELFSYDGKIFVLYDNEEAVCYMMYSEENGKADIIETVYKEPLYAKRLAEHLALNVSGLSYMLMSQNQNSAAHGMARVVDARGVLEEFGGAGILERAKIRDDFALWNNIGSGSGSISIGELARGVHMGFERALGKAGAQYADILNMDINNRFTCIFEEY